MNPVSTELCDIRLRVLRRMSAVDGVMFSNIVIDPFGSQAWEVGVRLRDGTAVTMYDSDPMAVLSRAEEWVAHNSRPAVE